MAICRMNPDVRTRQFKSGARHFHGYRCGAEVLARDLENRTEAVTFKHKFDTVAQAKAWMANPHV